MQLLEKNRTQFACLFTLTTTTIYLSIYPFSALKLLSSLPWLALFAYVVVLGLSYQYKQGKVLFTALLIIAYQAVPLGFPQMLGTSFYTSIVPQLMIAILLYLGFTPERGVSGNVINERVLTSFTAFIGLAVINMLLTKYTSSHVIGLYLVLALGIPALLYLVWTNGTHQDVVFSYIGICMVIMGIMGVPPNNFMLLCFSLALLFIVLKESHNMAYRDQLTGISSRRAMEVQASGLGKRFAVVMCDVDHFKKFNDTYGHDTGDDVLRLVAKKLACVGGGGLTYRYGGEEFCIIFKNKSGQEAFPYIEPLRLTIANYTLILRDKDRKQHTKEMRGISDVQGQQSVCVTMSFGIAETLSGEKFEDVLKRADQRLYDAKEAGRNCVMPVA